MVSFNDDASILIAELCLELVRDVFEEFLQDFVIHLYMVIWSIRQSTIKASEGSCMQRSVK